METTPIELYELYSTTFLPLLQRNLYDWRCLWAEFFRCTSLLAHSRFFIESEIIKHVVIPQ